MTDTGPTDMLPSELLTRYITPWESMDGLPDSEVSALTLLHHGCVPDALLVLDAYGIGDSPIAERTVADIDEDPEQFKDDMLDIIHELKAADL